MYCPECGKYNVDEARFCHFCGTKLEEDTGGDTPPQTGFDPQEQSGPFQDSSASAGQNGPGKKKKKWIWLILAAVLIVVAAVAAAVFLWILPQQKEKKFNAMLDEGNRYLENLDYEKAEDTFLQAIDIAPKHKEPYVKLAELYLDNGEKEKARSILSDARKALSKEDKKDIEKLEEEWEDQLEGEDGEYVWAVEPEIEADELYYLKETDTREYAYNEMERQMFTDYAVIRQEDAYGLIDMEGEILGGMDYKEITSGYGYYLLESKEPIYEPEYGTETSSYYLAGDEILPAVAIAGDTSGFKGAFYYCDGLHNVADAYGEEVLGPITWTEPEHPIPVKDSDQTFEETISGSWADWNLWLAGLPSDYGLYLNGRMITDFEYNACGSWSSGLLAVKQKGKWGYVDEEGKVVIPIEYDASWNQYIPQNQSGEQDYCYAASEGYVVLVKDDKWEMRDTDGELVIAPGIFEELRPVYDGKCWAKQDGRWGVLELEKADDKEKDESGKADDEETVTADVYQKAYGPLLDQMLEKYRDSMGEYLSYGLYDIDGDGIKELLLQDGTCEADYKYIIYTIENGESEYLGEISGSHTVFYADESGGEEDYIIQVQGHMGYETVSHVWIQNGTVETSQISNRELQPDESYYFNSYPIQMESITDKSLLADME